MLEKNYDPKAHEKEIYKKWEESGAFTPDRDPNKKPFTLIMPPPNANGSLHLGHAVFVTIEDIMTRQARMNGYSALMLPGADHAGILTQVVFERKLKEEQNKTRFDLGREKFYEACYEFCEESKQDIYNQFKSIGASCDWSREKFTLDPTISNQVVETFKSLYRDGLIYKGKYLVNWCPRCATTLSNLEVDHTQEKTQIWTIKYPVKHPSNSPQGENSSLQGGEVGVEFIKVATTRPETMLGDSGVAVHPDDERYKSLIGKTAILPLLNREIPIVSEESVQSEFGTGAVKVTPAHDPVDYETGKNHNLEQIPTIDKFDKITENGGKYAGMDKYEARKRILEDLEVLGLIENTEDYSHEVGICERCKNKIESILSDEWYVKTQPLMDAAMDAVRSGETQILPKRSEKVFFQWLSEYQPWPISRQIWWGHRIPVWYKKKLVNGEWEIDKENPIVSVSGELETDLVLVRHGHSEHNEKNILSADPEKDNYNLTDLGIKQSEELGETLKNKNFDLVIVSELKRAKQTTDIVMKYINCEQVLEDALVNDSKKGIYEGKTKDEFKEAIRKKEKLEGVERLEDLKLRAKSFIQKLLEKHAGKRILIISHSSFIWALLSEIDKKDYQEGTPNGMAFYRTLTSEISLEENEELVQDEDTLDTWFSSGQWPVTVLGGPNPTPDYKYFYPTSIMETGWDILFFWVARMIMFGKYMTGKSPFHTVYLHGLARDKHGQKMSKSKGNGIDPLIMSNKYGTDALRLALSVGTSPGDDFRVYEEKIEGFRNYVNKIWNAGRLIESAFGSVSFSNFNLSPKLELSKWILAQTRDFVEQVNQHFEKYEYGLAGEKIREFSWSTFCDWWLEYMKLEREKNEEEVKKVTGLVFGIILKTLHPYAPFVTEVLWQTIFENSSSENLIESSWPDSKNLSWIDFDVSLAKDLETVISTIRRIKKDVLKDKSGVPVSLKSENDKTAQFLKSKKQNIEKLCGVRVVNIETGKEIISYPATKDIKISFYLTPEEKKDALDLAIKMKENLEKYRFGVEKKLSNQNFVANAPKEIVEEERSKLEEAIQKLEELEMIV